MFKVPARNLEKLGFERSYPTPKVRGSGLEELPHLPGAAASKAQAGREELLHVQGQEGRPWEGTPPPR